MKEIKTKARTVTTKERITKKQKMITATVIVSGQNKVVLRYRVLNIPGARIRVIA